MTPTPIEAEPARRLEETGNPGDAGQETGEVEVKTRLPIWLHIAMNDAAARNRRSLSAELYIAAREHVENEARR